MEHNSVASSDNMRRENLIKNRHLRGNPKKIANFVTALHLQKPEEG